MTPSAEAGSLPTPPPGPLNLSERIRTDFAVVIPAYNEAPVVPDLISELRETFHRHDLRGEIIVVDDGSSDGTADRIREEAGSWEAVRVVRHRLNRGKTEAMVTAAEATERTWLVLFDADLQHATEEIPRFLEKLQEGWDIVAGRKVGHYDKRAVSSTYNRLSRAIFRVPVSDLNSMKAFRREVLLEIPLRHDWHRFFVVLAHARGYSVTEIDIELLPRRAGEAKYSGTSRILVGVLDLWSVWFLLLFSQKPLLLFGGAGAAFLGAGTLIGLVAIYFRYALQMGFRPLLYLVMLLVTVGVVLIGFGLLAEMVAQLREEVDAVRRDQVSSKDGKGL